MKPVKPKYDMLWKGMLEEVMADLLLFVDPDIRKEVHLERGFEFLDKELEAIYPEGKVSNTRVVDKLVKVFLRDGTERWILLHVEVQGKNGKEFPGRMFEYFVRLLGKRGHPVAAIAIMTGKNGKSGRGMYEYRCLWTRARYEYKTICITDYSDEVLAASSNPFAAVLQVAREVLLRVEGTDEDRDFVLLEEKTRLAKLLKERMAVFGEQKTAAILAFLNNYVVFKNPQINLIFMERTDEIFEKENTMGIIEQLAEIRREEGLEKGREIGLEEGREIGLEEGLGKAVRLFLANTEFSPEKIAELVGVSLAQVEKIKEELKKK